MPPESEIEKGYNFAANDLAIVLTELRQPHRAVNGILSECVDIKALVSRFQELRAERKPV